MEEYISFFKSLSLEVVGGIMGTVVLIVITSLYNIPKKLFYSFHEKRNEEAIRKVVKIRKILKNILTNSRSVYVQIIKYHNTGKQIKPNSLLKETIIWEETRIKCENCSLHGGKDFEIKPLQDDIQGITVTTGWSEIIYKTVMNKNSINTVKIDQLVPVDKKAFRDNHISIYKEVHILDTGTGIYVLAVSLCPNSNIDYPDRNLLIARDKLKKLLW